MINTVCSTEEGVSSAGGGDPRDVDREGFTEVTSGKVQREGQELFSPPAPILK